VLNDALSISEETKRKVRQVMSDMNYTPSSIATQLARKSSFNIGLLVDMSRRDDFLNHFFYNFIGGVESVIGPRVDGFILDNSLLTPQMAETFNEASFPFISIGELPAFTNMC
jgi:DNA-binding LacI/PurR family transcriptional regulator